MSILAPGFTLSLSPHALLAVTTMPADESNLASPAAWLELGGLLAFALVIALATGVFRPSRVDGPLRLPVTRPLWPLALVIGIAIAVWMGSNIFYAAVKQVVELQQGRGAGTGLPTSKPAEPTLVDFAVMSTVPGLLALAWMFLADRQLARTSQLQLGFTRRRFLDGVAKGLLASVMIMPVMFVAENLLEALYLKLHYQHPQEHMLLRLMTEAKTPFLRWCLIGGATVTAPFSEEYLFRGFLQTLLRQTFVNWTMMLTPRRTAPLSAGPLPGIAGTAPAPAEPPPPGEPPVMTLGYRAAAPAALPPPQGKRIWQTWAAILITSLLFASIHETWTAPLIFLLAVFLGYAYERTGSLWTSITIHLVFNTTSTIIYLRFSHGG